MVNHESFRLNKFLAERLGVSRREADELIAAGKITIGDRVAKLGDKVIPATSKLDKSNKVCYNGKIVPFHAEYSYLMFHKPVGYICSRRTQGSTPTLYELLPQEYHCLKTVGRLDRDSSGLILLTNDGDFAFQMTHPKFRKSKIYVVRLDKPLAPLHQQMISEYGIEIGDGVSKFKIIKDNDQYIVVLNEGRNRQIRRTFAALGYTVTKLHRIQFGKYELGDLQPGKYIQITKPY